MKQTVFEVTKGYNRVITNFCPGCTHGISFRIIMEVLDEKNMLGKTIGCGPIGCAVMAHRFMNVDMCECAHGRAPCVATGAKRVHPDHFVFTYQGDGDLASIGMGEIVHAAVRRENFTTFFINNAIYGMTGGQMAPTTLVGQKATTCQSGRQVTGPAGAGYPLNVSELMATIEGAVYVERVSLDTPGNVNKAKRAVERAYEVQEKKLGFSFVEMVSTCPTNWGLDPLESMDFLRNELLPQYPLGIFKKPEEVR